MTWLVIFAWVITACAPAQTSQPTSTVAQLTSVEEHEAQLEPASLGAGEKLQVIATTNIVADIVLQIGGDAIELTSLLPLGADPHTYTATPQDVIAVTKAHVIFANGADLEGDFLPQLIQHTQVPVVYLSQGVELRKLGATEAEGDEHGDEGIDPHTWTTPLNAAVFVRNIEGALSTLDPGRAELYATHAQEYTAELTSLDTWVQEQIATIPPDRRKLITDHQVFGYYADRYGLEQIGAVIPSFSTASQPSAQELAALEDKIRQYGVRTIFVGATVNPALAEQVAADTGIRVVTLYIESMGPPGSGVETYVDYIRYNTNAIVQGLR
jgi:ABC-type Zn uptake system ZnuABC Zn-binding protein ZnuA